MGAAAPEQAVESAITVHSKWQKWKVYRDNLMVAQVGCDELKQGVPRVKGKARDKLPCRATQQDLKWPELKARLLQFIPLIIAGCVVIALAAIHAISRRSKAFDWPMRLEWMTYDWRARLAAGYDSSAATNLGVVEIDENSLQRINERDGQRWPLPRHYYARLLRELSAQGVESVAFDLFFVDRDKTQVKLSGASIFADELFAHQIKKSGNVILGTPSDTTGGASLLPPHVAFHTNAWAIGHAAKLADSDGVARRIKPFIDDEKLGRVWQMGIVMASHSLGLDLENAEVGSDSIVLRGADGSTHTIPTDEEGMAYIDWQLASQDSRTLRQNFSQLLDLDTQRGKGNPPEKVWQGKIAIVGSTGAGSNLKDTGASPLSPVTHQFTAILNVANSVLTGRFVRPCSYGLELGLLLGMTTLAAVASWKLRALWGSIAIGAMAVAYVGFACWLYITQRFWLPVVLPVGGSLMITHALLVTYRAFVERTERRRVWSLFGRMVSPNIINLLLQQPDLSFGTTRRVLTVYFADVRGFTRFTDESRARAEEHVRRLNLDPKSARAHLDQVAADDMATVNLYLSAIVDAIKRHDGTLDKYIGDCVMAFWGAPLENEHQSVAAVRAAIDAQRSIHALNEKREAENACRQTENATRLASGLEPLPPLAVLTMGSGINTGLMTVGFMGSEEHLSNYTVFGHEVNLASRLEGVSGKSRIIISEATCAEIRRLDPELASCITPLSPVEVKGIADPVAIHEVDWRKECIKTLDRGGCNAIAIGRPKVPKNRR